MIFLFEDGEGMMGDKCGERAVFRGRCMLLMAPVMQMVSTGAPLSYPTEWRFSILRLSSHKPILYQTHTTTSLALFTTGRIITIPSVWALNTRPVYLAV